MMNLQDRFKQGVANTLKIDFSKSQTAQDVSLFETTIRYLAGILSAYELSGATNAELLDQARKLGDKLLVAWPDDRQNLPFPMLNFAANRPSGQDFISAASAGSLILEFDRLSFYTRQPKYLQYATKAIQAVMNIPSVLPGLPGFLFGVKNQTVLNDKVTWSGGADSYLEYLLKYGMLINNRDPSYYDVWKLAVKSSIQKLIQVAPVRNLTYLADSSSATSGLDFQFTHLACFASGNWLLGGKVFNDSTVFDYGVKLLTTCMETYKRTATGLGPEIFRFLGPNGEAGSRRPGPEELAFFQRNGFYIADSSYKLRPEVIESAFYAWRLTGDPRYQEFVWDAFKSLQNYCKAAASYAELYDVNNLSSQLDASESFLFAETFKYIYLTFSDPTVLSLDQYVFNTEAHPFRFQHSAILGSTALSSPSPNKLKSDSSATVTTPTFFISLASFGTLWWSFHNL